MAKFYISNDNNLNLMSFMLNPDYYFLNKETTFKQLKELKFDDFNNLDFFIKTQEQKQIPTFLWTSYVISILTNFKEQLANSNANISTNPIIPSFLLQLKTILKIEENEITNKNLISTIDSILKQAKQNFKNEVALTDYLKKVIKAQDTFSINLKQAILNKNLNDYVSLALCYNQIEDAGIFLEDEASIKKDDDLLVAQEINDFYSNLCLQNILKITSNDDFLLYLYNLNKKTNNYKIADNTSFLYFKNYWLEAYYSKKTEFYTQKLGGIKKVQEGAINSHLYTQLYLKNPSYKNGKDCFLQESALLDYQTGNVVNFWNNFNKDNLDIFAKDDDYEQKCNEIFIDEFFKIVTNISKIDENCPGYFANGLFYPCNFVPIDINKTEELLQIHNNYMQYFKTVLIYKLAKILKEE